MTVFYSDLMTDASMGSGRVTPVRVWRVTSWPEERVGLRYRVTVSRLECFAKS